MKRRGFLLVLSSPSGAGKTSMTRRLLEQDSRFTLSVSATTRPPRPGETDGKDYHFWDKQRFHQKVQEGGFLEHAQVFDHNYGTPLAPVEEALAKGRDVLFDVDWQGSRQIGQKMPADLVRLFLLPPSLNELEARLHKRAQDNSDVVAARMAKAAGEIDHWGEYDYVLVNDDFEQTYHQITQIIAAERLRRDRQLGLTEFVQQLLDESA